MPDPGPGQEGVLPPLASPGELVFCRAKVGYSNNPTFVPVWHTLTFGGIMPSMLDWYIGLLGYNASCLRLGQYLEVNPSGEIVHHKDRAEVVMGSYQSKVLVGRGTSTPAMRDAAERLGLLVNPEVLWVSGNPVKFIQGHNVFGPSVSYLGSIVKEFVRRLPDDVRPGDADSELWPTVHRSRVDITTMVDLRSHALVHEWLEAATSNTRSRHGRSFSDGSTVYWNHDSRRWTLLAYCKSCELLKHPVANVELNELLKHFVEGKLRVELRLKRLELKDKGTLDEGLVWKYFERVHVGGLEMYRLKDGRPVLRPQVGMCFDLWMQGKDLAVRLPRRTFYRYRREILDETGIDISIARCEQEKAVEKVRFDAEYLKENELKDVPDYLQRFLFRPDACPSYGSG